MIALNSQLATFELAIALAAIIRENNEFRETLPGEKEDWLDDPLLNAIDHAEKVVERHLGKEWLQRELQRKEIGAAAII